MAKEKDTMKDLLQNAATQYYQFRFALNMRAPFENVKALIAQEKSNFKNLPKYIGKSRKRIELFSPGACDKYEEWGKKISDPNISEAEFRTVTDEVFELGKDLP